MISNCTSSVATCADVATAKLKSSVVVVVVVVSVVVVFALVVAAAVRVVGFVMPEHRVWYNLSNDSSSYHSNVT